MIEIGVVSILGAVLAFILGREVGRTWRRERREKARRPVTDDDPELDDRRVSDRLSMILDRARRGGQITNDDVQAMFNVSHTTAWRLLEELEKEGKVRQRGTTGRGTSYEPT